MNIEYVGRDAIIQAENMAFTYQVASMPRVLEDGNRISDLDFNGRQDFIDDYRVYPYGANNDLPDLIKGVVQNNSLAPGILTKSSGMLWGDGPLLYKEIIEDRKVIRDWQDNSTVRAWLNNWDYEAYLLQMSIDYQHMQGVFTKYELARGSRLGNNFIHHLEGIEPSKARLASLRSSNSPKATHIITNDWSFATPLSMDYKVYDKFDFNRPFAFKNSILYSNKYSFCTDYYTIPDLYGSIEWLRRSTATPLILKAYAKNSMNLAYHVISPQAYWDAKEEEIKDECIKKGVPYDKKMLYEYEAKLLKTVSDVLSGEENAGKYWHTKKIIDANGHNIIEHGWEIKIIDQKAKEFVESQILVSDRADRAVSAGIGLNGALGNVSESGRSDGGSEQLYALKNYMATSVNIPEMIVMKAMNYALRANFPGLDLKMGFYRIQPEKEQNVAPKDRFKNNV